jgi:hypothetical protein
MEGHEVVYLTVLATKNLNIYDSSNQEKVGPIAHMKLNIVGFFCITLLCDMGPHNIIVGCWELNMNLSLPMQLFKRPTVTF